MGIRLDGIGGYTYRARRVSGKMSEVIDVSAKTCQHAEKKAREGVNGSRRGVGGVNEAVGEASERVNS